MNKYNIDWEEGEDGMDRANTVKAQNHRSKMKTIKMCDRKGLYHLGTYRKHWRNIIEADIQMHRDFSKYYVVEMFYIMLFKCSNTVESLHIGSIPNLAGNTYICA